MIINVVMLMLGLVIAVLAVVSTRVYSVDRFVLGWALVLAAFWHVGFEAVEGEDIYTFLTQILGALVFLVFAYQGLVNSEVWLGVGWLSHVIWDTASLSLLSGAAPEWAAFLCIGFDLFVGCYFIQKIQVPKALN